MTTTYEHFVRPADQAELAGAVHIVRAMQRQLAAQLATLADQVADSRTRRALEDAAHCEQQSCAVLTSLLLDIDERTFVASPGGFPHPRVRDCGDSAVR